MSHDLACPTCGTELDLAAMFSSQADAKALERLVEVGYPLGTRVLRYIALHKPPKQHLTARKKIKLLLELLPDLERQAITRSGRTWSAPRPLWAQAFDQLTTTAEAGRLDLPLKGHGYLYAVLQSQADKAEAAQERQTETERRTGQTLSLAPKTVRGAGQSIGDAALAALDQRDRDAAPIPDAVRQKLAELRALKAPAPNQPLKGTQI